MIEKPEANPSGEMLGAEGVSRGLVRLLRARVPVHLARQRHITGATPVELPDPDPSHIFPTPQPFADLSTFPALMVSMEATDGRATNRQESPSGSYDELVMLYRVSVFVWAIGPEYDLAQLALQRYVLATRAALITGRVIGDQTSGNWAEVELDRLREQYTDPMQAREGTGWVAGGWVEAGLRAHELVYTDHAWRGEPRLEAAPVAAVPRVRVETEPVHPAMEGEPGQW